MHSQPLSAAIPSIHYCLIHLIAPEKCFLMNNAAFSDFNCLDV